jgi:hypothetical protein
MSRIEGKMLAAVATFDDVSLTAGSPSRFDAWLVLPR